LIFAFVNRLETYSVNRLLRFEEVHITVKGITDENRDFLTQVAMERDEQM